MSSSDGAVEFLDAGFGGRFDAVPRSSYESQYAQKGSAIVIDAGSYELRAGFAGEADPRLQFRSLVSRVRTKDGKGFATLVGNQIPYLEAYRLKPRSPFDRNVVSHFPTMETLLDYTFESLGLSGSPRVDHPVLLTEPLCNPNFSRGKVAELLFECYQAPSISFGLSEMFSYSLRAPARAPLPDGLIVQSGHEVSHVIPVLDGRACVGAAAAVPVGGLQAQQYLFDQLLLKYPQHAKHLSLYRCEELVRRFGAFAPGAYAETLRKMQSRTKLRRPLFSDYTDPKDTKRIKEPEPEPTVASDIRPVRVQLPFVAVEPVEESAEEVARRKRLRKARGDRLRKLAAERRKNKLAEQRALLASYDALSSRLSSGDMTEEDFLDEIRAGGFDDRADFEKTARKLRASVLDVETQTGSASSAPTPTSVSQRPESQSPLAAAAGSVAERERYPLLFVDSSQLTAEQKKEQRKQKLMRGAELSRARRRREKEEERAEKERRAREEQQQYERDPKGYVAQLRRERDDIVERRNRRKQRGTDRRRAAANNLSALRAVMGGKSDSAFGDDEADWQAYTKLGKSAAGGDASDDERKQLDAIQALIRKYDPEGSRREDIKSRYPQACDFQLELYVERVRVHEPLFQPSMIGLRCAGLGETIGNVFASVGADKVRRICSNIVAIGGNARCENFLKRLEFEVRSRCPQRVRVSISGENDPADGWRGASRFAASPEFSSSCVTRQEYEEMGWGYLKEHVFSNRYFETPKR